MKLRRFRVQNYRNINDSGWIEAEDILAVIGPNESGKTSILTALYKFNPADPTNKFNINREWPRGRRGDRSDSSTPITVEFELSREDKEALAEVFHRAQNVPAIVTIKKNYKNEFLTTWPTIEDKAIPPEDQEARNAQKAAIRKRMPIMVYMGDYETFQGCVYLDDLVKNKAENRMTKADETVEIILKLSGLDAANLSTRGEDRDREERQLDLSDAAQSLTNQIAKRWGQKSYELQFTADGQMFITNVKEPGSNALVRLEDKSKGFQWFVSFDMRLMHDTKGTWHNAILLLDEPGVHLHGDAQADLLKRFDEYSEGNQIIYSTHLPFMLDIEHPERFRIMVQDGVSWRVTDNPFEAADSAKFPLHVAMGFSLAQTLFIGQHNLVVEGTHDLWFILEMSGVLKALGSTPLRKEITVTSSGGAPKVPYMCALLSGHKLKVAVLLDSDQEGQRAKDELVKKWIVQDKLITTIEEITGIGNSTVEDLFDRAFYLKAVNKVYGPTISSPIAASDLPDTDPILAVIGSLVTDRGGAFNKGSVAKEIIKTLPKSDAKSLGKTVESFEKLFSTINDRTGKWFEDAPAFAVVTGDGVPAPAQDSQHA